jgi:hypothetical protein
LTSNRAEVSNSELDLVSYTVKANQIVEVTGLAVYYSEPLVPMCQSVGWTVTINGGRVPNISHQTDLDFYYPIGSIDSPLAISPFWAQSGDVIAIHINPSIGWTGYLMMVGVIAGEVYRMAGFETGGR